MKDALCYLAYLLIAITIILAPIGYIYGTIRWWHLWDLTNKCLWVIIGFNLLIHSENLFKTWIKPIFKRD